VEIENVPYKQMKITQIVNGQSIDVPHDQFMPKLMNNGDQTLIANKIIFKAPKKDEMSVFKVENQGEDTHNLEQDFAYA